ncbi:MAG: OadG family protein [Lachnospiraceae bacterium]|nr:OadG family protein [Lachnospiraceae bacterium]
MKKIIALLCTITCMIGLTACGGEETYTTYEQQKMDYAKSLATESVIPFFQNFMDDSMAGYFDENTAEEIEFVVGNQFSLNVEGNAVTGGIISFNSAKESIGNIVSIGEATAEIDDKTIIVTVPVEGELKNANAELIFSNDMFMYLESAALNEESNMGELMTRAGLNTIIGMGTVFLVLILISLIISLFGFIPKIQAKFAKKEETNENNAVSIDNTISQIVTKEESVEVSVSDDLELVAVIAAAIAASQGATSTDGFVVRSIRKRR